ncbi:hypothetical protein LSG31_00455 [Fodinisporobacter ferrooxydans]|uniref:Phage protein n=1 Tax=Fodinisporobacter ferrooxydans TaxID=2901836 RepID=A0ABY4CKD4_9BACL|nr:hypothetical protein LSG31_00455 [Alicyclobacillaceae bacterium MYW30-H2]
MDEQRVREIIKEELIKEKLISPNGVKIEGSFILEKLAELEKISQEESKN